MQTCGANPRGVRVEWRDGGRTRLVGFTELGRMMGTDPNLGLSVLDGLGRWEAGRSASGMGLQRKGWVRVHDRAGETSNSNSTSTSSGERTPPPKAPKNKPRFESSEDDTPPSEAQQTKPKP